MTSRRSAISALLLSPVLFARGLWAKPSPQAVLPDHLSKLARTFDPDLGDMGRGHYLPLDQVIKLRSEIEQYGFTPFLVPGMSGFNSRFLPLYSANGTPIYGIWFGFVRALADRHEVIAFEATPEDVKEFVARTGCGGLDEAMSRKK